MTQQQDPAAPYAWQSPGPPPQRARSRGKTGTVVLFIVAVFLSCGTGIALGALMAQPEAGMPSTPRAAEAPPGATMIDGSPSPRAVAASVPEVDDGVWAVGDDLPAGTYRTTDKVSSRCYWEISKTGSGGADIVANDLPGGGRPQVTLKKGQTFKTDNCGTWRKV